MFRHDHPRPQIEWMLRARQVDCFDHPLTYSVFAQSGETTKTGKRQEVGIAFADFSGFSVAGFDPDYEIMRIHILHGIMSG